MRPAMTRRGWLRAWGGAADSTVVTLSARAPPPDAEFERTLEETRDVYLVARGAAFFERPPSNNSPSFFGLPH